MDGFRDIGVAINIASFGHAVWSWSLVALDIGLVWNGGLETSCFNSSFSFLFVLRLEFGCGIYPPWVVQYLCISR